MAALTFRALVETWREDMREPGEKPEGFLAVAKRCGLSRQHFYALMAGTRVAPELTIENIAAGLCHDHDEVAAALSASQTAHARLR